MLSFRFKQKLNIGNLKIIKQNKKFIVKQKNPKRIF
jgi:hypothetical protein